jgi:hypothetical protein
MHGGIGILRPEFTLNQFRTIMDEWLFFSKLGWEHILSVDAWDHLLFLASLGSLYLLQSYKEVLAQVSVFAVGHTLSLAINVWTGISFSSTWVEFLIPATIVATAADAYRRANENSITIPPYRWALLLVFGTLHGLGFANTFRFLLPEEIALTPALTGFTIGLELAQFLIIGCLMIAGKCWTNWLKWPKKHWIRWVNALCFLIGLYLCIQRFPF